MEIRVNGKNRQVEEGLTLAGLLAQLDMDARRLAIEYNGRILLGEDDREQITLAGGDSIEILRLVGGG